MRQTVAQRDVSHFGVGQAPQQFAARAVEPDIAKCRARSFSEKDPKLPLQGSTGYTGDASQFGHAPVAPDICTHRIECAADGTRQQRLLEGSWARAFIGGTPTIRR